MAIRTNTRLGGTRYTVWPLGSDLVASLAAVTEANSYTSDFTVDEDGWVAYNGTGAGNIDAIGGKDNNLRLTVNDVSISHRIDSATVYTIGNAYRVRLEYYIPAGQSHIDGIRFYLGDGPYTLGATLGAWTALDYYLNAAVTEIACYAVDNNVLTFQDAGGDDVFYLRAVIIDAVTFTNWTEGTGWAPEASAGALTGKALKTAGTASALEQDVSAVVSHPYQVVYTNDQSTTGKSINSEVGGVDGATVTADATTTDEIFTTTTGNLKIEAAADWGGKIGPIACKKRG